MTTTIYLVTAVWVIADLVPSGGRRNLLAEKTAPAAHGGSAAAGGGR